MAGIHPMETTDPEFRWYRVTSQKTLIFIVKPTWCIIFLVMFINLYMFRWTMCPSSGETTVLRRHLVLVIVWMTVWYAGWHTRQSSTQNNKYQVSHKYSCFSWWWAHSCPKHVEKRNKHSKKNCASLYNLVNKANLVHNFPYYVYFFLYMFWATMCPSSGETAVFMRHLALVILYSTLHTRQSSIQNNKYQVSHKYSFSWWWAHSRPKHIERRNKHTKKSCAPSWFYLQDYTEMHGQQNIEYFVFFHHR
jgi:hypothetical protein